MKRYNKHSSSRIPQYAFALAQLVLCICTNDALAQSNPSNGSQGPISALPSISAPARWSDLDAAQQQALYPLRDSWADLSDIQRRKWIAIVKNFPKLKPEDQAKLQERMSAWAALAPQERERARENFANSKLTKPTNKADSWEAYRALPQEERDKLASQATKKRPGAAKTPKPPPPAPLGETTLVPRTPPTADERSDLRNLITPDTLLPRARQQPQHQ